MNALRPVFLAVPVLALWSGSLGAEEPADPSLLDLDRIFESGEFEPESAGPFRWRKNAPGYTALESAAEGGGRDIVLHDPETGSREVLVPASRLVPCGESSPMAIDDYAFSDDGSRLLVYTNSKRVWRQNSRGDYWVLDLGSRELRQLGGDAKPSTLQFAAFSPDCKRVAYVRQNDLYVEDLAERTIIRLTDDGSERLINGTFDWVYEEELNLRRGFRWSPDSRLIAFWQLDTEGVREFHLINNTDSLYPRLLPIKYPKVGEKNSAARIGVIGAGGGKARWLELSGDSREHYIAWMDWAGSSNEILIQQLNRLQNANRVLLAEVLFSKTPEFPGSVEFRVRTVLEETDRAWVEVNEEIHWIDDGREFLWLTERDGWNHLYRVSRHGDAATLLTCGDYDVIRIEKVDEKNGRVYFIASPDDPTRRYLYRIGLDGRGFERVTPEGEKGTHSYQVSPDSRWAIHTRSAFDQPPAVSLINLPEHRAARAIAANEKLREKIAALKRQPAEFFRIDIGDGVLLDAWCLRPPDLDPEKRYPALFHVYGEPAGQTVLDRWSGKQRLWHLMLTQKGYFVFSIDNRGTPAPRGRDWRKVIYRQVGILASADQAAAARALIRERPNIDPERIGVWGWSGGGSMSLNLIFRHPDLYQTAMAVAPVPNQRLYDTIYQERYMGLPGDNADGYVKGSPITYAHQLKGNLLLVHGTGDDNVHYQGTEALINELIVHNKPFTMMAYPNRTHAIREGKNTTRHLYDLLTRYLLQNLPPGAREK